MNEANCRFPVVGLGPLSADDIVRMTELSTEFHPVHVVDEVAKEAGYSGLVLHPLWLSGLVDKGIRMMFPAAWPKQLILNYRCTASYGDALKLLMSVSQADSTTAERILSFEIWDQRGQCVADGLAVIKE